MLCNTALQLNEEFHTHERMGGWKGEKREGGKKNEGWGGEGQDGEHAGEEK